MAGQSQPTGRVVWTGYLALPAVLALAAGLRLFAFTWGLPNETHMFSYHPDEFHSLRGALSLALGDPNPHFFNYGSLYLYLVALAAMVGSLAIFASISQAAPGGPELPAAIRAWTLDARAVTLLLGLATVYVVYLTARRIWGHRAGLLAAGALALMPLHVVHSHYATVDVPGAFFVALTLYFAVRTVEEPSLGNLVWAGITSGLAASVKYSGGLVIVAPLVAWLMGTDRRRWQAPVIIIACAAAAFALTSPYTLLDWRSAWRDISFEMQHMRTGDDPSAIARDPNGWWFHLKQLHLAVTWPLLAAAVWGAVAGLRNYWRHALPLLVFALLAFAVMGSAQVRYARYEIVLLPVIAVLAGSTLALRRQASDVGGRAPWLRSLELVVIGLGLCLALGMSAIWLQLMWADRPDGRRAEALAAVEQIVSASGLLGLVSEPWFHQPPVDYCNGGPALRSNPIWGAYRRPVCELRVVGLHPEAILAAMPDALLFTWFDQETGGEQVERFREELVTDFSQVQLASAPGDDPPPMLWPEPAHDWRYVAPGVELWQRREPLEVGND